MSYSDEEFREFMIEQDMDIADILQLVKEQVGDTRECEQFLNKRIAEAERLYDMRDKYKQIERIIQDDM